MLQLRTLAASASILGVPLGAGPGGTAPVSEKRFKFTKEFKRGFEAVVPKKTACGVLVVPDVPATSYYGATRTFKQERSGSWYSPGGLYYPLAVVDGRIIDTVPEKGGFRTLSRKDYLIERLQDGEILAITDIDYRSEGLRMDALTIRPRKIQRGKNEKTGAPIVYDELFGVEFLFVPSLDRVELTASDVQPVLSYVEKTMKLFPDLSKAASFALARITHRAPKKPAKKPRQP